MPLIEIDRASDEDKRHTKRVLHAFAQLTLNLFTLQDARVDAVLSQYDITLWPGPSVGIKYPPDAKQICQKEPAKTKAKKKR